MQALGLPSDVAQLAQLHRPSSQTGCGSSNRSSSGSGGNRPKHDIEIGFTNNTNNTNSINNTNINYTNTNNRQTCNANSNTKRSVSRHQRVNRQQQRR